MRTAAIVLTGFVALQHVVFLALEMFLWTKPLGLRVFRMEKTQAEATAVLAKNQGLYNGFLAAGLIWGLLGPDLYSWPLKVFFLACVAVAGIYGGFSASLSILWVQALPAVMALTLVLISR